MSHGDQLPALTRREVLVGAAAAGATALVFPGVGVGAPRSLFSLDVGSLSGSSRALSAPRRFGLVGVTWVQPHAARIELRTRAHGEAWSEWALASVVGHDGDSARGLQQFGEPIWSGAADYVQLRSPSRVRDVRLHFLAAAGAGSVAGAPSAHAAGRFALAQPVLDAGPGQPAIIARSAWAQGQAPPAVPAAFGTIKLAFVHHTQSLNGYAPSDVPAMLLSIYDYHVYVRGLHDIAYNFLIDAFGRIWEGRAGGIDEPVVGGHAGDWNQFSTGVAVLGSFIGAPPPRRAIRALEHLLAWKLSLHGVPAHGHVRVRVDPTYAFYTPFVPGSYVSLPRVAGHRDGDTTDCPGDAFYARLPSIRPRIVALAGAPARLTLTSPPQAFTAGIPSTVSGRLEQLADGAAIAGASVEIQRVSPYGEVTIATASSGSDGSFSADVILRYDQLVRALQRAAPAAASDPVQVAVAPQFTLSVPTVSPVQVDGTVFPQKRWVRLAVRSLDGGRPRLTVRRRVRARGGQFQANFGQLAPGSYTVIARAAADARNAAGASAPLTFTVP